MPDAEDYTPRSTVYEALSSAIGTRAGLGGLAAALPAGAPASALSRTATVPKEAVVGLNCSNSDSQVVPLHMADSRDSVAYGEASG